MDSRREIMRVIKEVLSDDEAELLCIFVAGIQAARAIRDCGQAVAETREESA